MESSPESFHSFIVRIWREPREILGARPQWRGLIEHVASGQRRYVTDLEGIANFIKPYIRQLGVGVREKPIPADWLQWLKAKLRVKS